MEQSNPRSKMPLKHRLETRVTDSKFRELSDILSKNSNLTMSRLLRQFLNDRPVKVYVRDETVDLVITEMAKIRGEIKAIGVNINQITRLFNTYPEPKRKEFYAKIAFAEYLKIEEKIDRLLQIVSTSAKKWFQK